MMRIVAVLLTFAVLSGCAAGSIVAARPPRADVVVIGAAGVTADAHGRGAWRISYRAPNAAANWYAQTAQRLEARGWTSGDEVAYAPLNRSYTRATPLGIAVVWEWAWFSLDPLHPEVAHIRVQRTIDVPWWRQVRHLVAGAQRVIVPLLPER